MNNKELQKWLNYVDYICEHHEKTDRVWRDSPYCEYYQFAEEKRDIRDDIDDKIKREILIKAISLLTERERLVINHYYEMYDHTNKTLKGISWVLNVSAPWVGKIHKKAIMKLRSYFCRNIQQMNEIRGIE